MDWKRLLFPNWYITVGFFVIFYYLQLKSYVFDAVIYGLPIPFYSAEGFCPPTGCPPGTFYLGYLIADIIITYLVLCLSFYYRPFSPSESRVKTALGVMGNFLIGIIVSVALLIGLSILFSEAERIMHAFTSPQPVYQLGPENIVNAS